MNDSIQNDAPAKLPAPPRISDMAEDDRPREKAIQAGNVRGLSVTELIAIALGSGIPGRPVMTLSNEILSLAGGHLRGLGRLEIEDLTYIKGVGRAKAISLLAAIELGMRVARDTDSGTTQSIRNSDDIAMMMRDLKTLNHEEFWVIFVDRRNQVISKYALSVGGTAGTVVDTKLLFKKAILMLASGIIVVHNHPGGSLRPSPEDDRLTQRIKDGCKMLDIRMLDHVIITSGSHYSYNDDGRL